MAQYEAAAEVRAMQGTHLPVATHRPVVNITAYGLQTAGLENVEFVLLKKSKETTKLESVRMTLIYDIWQEITHYCKGDRVELDMLTGTILNGPPEYILIAFPEMLLNLITEIYTKKGTITLHDEKIDNFFRLGFRKHEKDQDRKPKKEKEGDRWGHVVAFSDCTKSEGKIQLAVYKQMEKLGFTNLEANWKQLEVKEGRFRKWHTAFTMPKEVYEIKLDKMYLLKKIEVDGDPNQIVKLHLSDGILTDESSPFISICKVCYKIRPCYGNCEQKKMKGCLTSSKEQKEIEMENAKKRRLDELAKANRKAKAGPPPVF